MNIFTYFQKYKLFPKYKYTNKTSKIAEHCKVGLGFLGESMKTLLEHKESALEKSVFFAIDSHYKKFKKILRS